MALLIGVLLAIGVGLLATLSGMDRDRAFYPTVTIVVASYYSLYAAIGASTHVLLLETLIGVGFLVLAVVGFRSSMWLVVLALGGHGIFDFVHGQFITNPGMPAWWPEFCAAYDVTAAAYLSVLLAKRGPPANAG